MYTRYVQVLGTGEAACLSMAEVHGWSIASDERGKFSKLARLRLGNRRILNTPGIFVLSIRASLLSVKDADHHKDSLEMNRFKMQFSSFGDVIIESQDMEE